MDTIGSRIEFCRGLADHLSGRELSILANLSQAYIRMVERNERERLGYQAGMRVASVLGIDFQWLMTGEGKPPVASRVRRAVHNARVRRASSNTPEAA